MLTINCTKKMCDELEFSIESVAKEDKDDFYNWHANLVRFNRRKCVILMNVETRYSIFLYGLKKEDFQNFSNLCREAIQKNFKADRLAESQIDEYLAKAEDIKYTKTYNRSVIASMNNAKQNIGYKIRDILPTEKKIITRLSKHNNRIPILTMEPAYPIKALRQTVRDRIGVEQQKVYQFRISLKEIKPKIWRRLVVPANYTFWDLHVAIQDVMDWQDYHLHEFRVKNPVTGEEVEIGWPNQEFEQNVLAGWEERVDDYFVSKQQAGFYIYDFGDYWQHELELEQIKPADEEVNHPQCLAGERASPPEDCGGVGGYYQLIEILANQNHSEYDRMIEWVGGEYNPDYFNREEIEFSDPDSRL